MKNVIPAMLLAAMMISTPAAAYDQGMETWLAIPEDPANAPSCVLDKKFSEALATLKAKGATPTQMMRWGEVEAEKYAPGGIEWKKTAAQYPNADPEGLLPLGVQKQIIGMILEQDAFSKYPPEGWPGFPAFAYRSCLKGKPIGESH
jgi:hypothetical protein